jgi:hypothetical protein
MHKKPTREVSGSILWGLEEQVNKGTNHPARADQGIKNLITLLRPLPSITKLIRNGEETVRYIICASSA